MDKKADDGSTMPLARLFSARQLSDLAGTPRR